MIESVTIVAPACSSIAIAAIKAMILLRLISLPVLSKALTEYPAVVRSAGEQFAPSVIAAYAYDLAKQFNGYYHDHSILKEENVAARSLRLKLAGEVARVIRSAMSLLGINVPERM